jgi:mercuric ion transport protein
MNHDHVLTTGVIGSVMAALCCATPVLAVLLGAVGVGWFVG